MMSEVRSKHSIRNTLIFIGAVFGIAALAFVLNG